MRPSDIHRRREEERFRLYGNDDQPDFVSQPQEEQYTPQHTSQSPTVYIQRVSTPAPVSIDHPVWVFTSDILPRTHHSRFL